MGLSSNLKAWILHYLSPRCWVPVVEGEATLILPGAVRLLDILTTLHFIRGPRGDFTFTGDEAFSVFMVPIKNFLKGPEQALCIIVDSQAGVPWQKHKEQAARRREPCEYPSSHPDGFVKYEDDSIITDAGLVRPMAVVNEDDMECKVEDMVEVAPAPERFILEEVLMNSKLREKLFRYFHERMINDGLDVPEGKVVRFVFDSVGSWRFEANGVTVRDVVDTTKDSGPVHGEYDITSIKWACAYRNCPIVFQTIDTDTIPLLVALLTTHEFTQPVRWIFDTTGYIDCKIMVDDVLKVTGLSARLFILGCILGGTDYVQKRVCANQFNDGAIFAVLRHPNCGALFQRVEMDQSDDTRALRGFVRWLHTSRLDPNITAIKSRSRNAKAAVTRARNLQTKRKQMEDSYDMDEEKNKRSKVVVESDNVDVAEEEESATVSVTSAAASSSGKVPQKRTSVEWAQLAATSMTKEYELVHHWMSQRERPLLVKKCKANLGKKWTIPSEQELQDVMGLVQFNTWYWQYAWNPNCKEPSFEEWRKVHVVGESLL